MMPKKSVQTIAYSLSLGLVTFLAAYFSHGLYLKKLLPIVIAVIFGGLVSAFSLIRKGKKADQECDEREQFINMLSMKYTFYAMTFIIMALWAYKVALSGSFKTTETIILYSFWGTFLLSYGINKIRH